MASSSVPSFTRSLKCISAFPRRRVDRLQKGLAIRSHGAAQGFIGIEDGAEAERKNGQGTKTLANHAGVVDNGLLGEGLCGENDR